MATHGKGEEWVHGWKFNNYSCYHNGVVEVNNKKILNDSYDFFKAVCKEEQLKYKNIEEELQNRTGSGAFYMIHNNKGEHLIFSKRHTITVQL